MSQGKTVSPYRFIYLEKEASVATEKLRKSDRTKGEEAFVAVALKILGKLEDNVVTEQEASSLFSRFLPFAYSYFTEELSDVIRAGCLLPLPKRPHNTAETIEKMRKTLHGR